MREIIHLCPPKGSSIMPCCGANPLEKALLDVPAYAAIRKRDDEGNVVYTQMRLEDMTLPQLEAKAEAIGRTRDTLSVEYRFDRDLIELMQSDTTLVTAGDALRRLAA